MALDVDLLEENLIHYSGEKMRGKPEDIAKVKAIMTGISDATQMDAMRKPGEKADPNPFIQKAYEQLTLLESQRNTELSQKKGLLVKMFSKGDEENIFTTAKSLITKAITDTGRGLNARTQKNIHDPVQMLSQKPTGKLSS